MTRQEIQKKSAEKQEKILDCLRREGRPMTVKEVTKVLGLPYKEVRLQFENLRIKNAVECVSKYGNEYLYTIRTAETKSCKRQLEQADFRAAITEREIETIRRKIKPGAVYHYRDEEGIRRRTKVTDTRYPHICLFDNGQAYTWADVVRCSRPGIQTLGEWEK